MVLYILYQTKVLVDQLFNYQNNKIIKGIQVKMEELMLLIMLRAWEAFPSIMPNQ